MPDAAPWLAAHVHLIQPGGSVLDVACGRGRNARYLAAQGFRVHAVDRDAGALAALHDVPGISTALIDLEAGAVSFGHALYDAVVVCNYLHRPLMPAIVDAVALGGVLIYETFTRRQAARGRPTNPDFLLEDGELHALVAPLTVSHAREGEFEGKFIASVVAMR